MTEPPQKVQRVDATDPPVARLLSVPFVHEYGGGESFYVRECYNKYYSIVEKLLVEENKQCVTVTGTPGEELLCAWMAIDHSRGDLGFDLRRYWQVGVLRVLLRPVPRDP